jgi:hypothetical protein
MINKVDKNIDNLKNKQEISHFTAEKTFENIQKDFEGLRKDIELNRGVIMEKIQDESKEVAKLNK